MEFNFVELAPHPAKRFREGLNEYPQERVSLERATSREISQVLRVISTHPRY